MATFTSFVYYTGDGSTAEYQIIFDYLSKDFVYIYVDGVLQVRDTDYVFSGERIINFLSVPTTGALILIKRITDPSRLVEFRDASILTANDLDISTLQSIHISEEANDTVNNSIVPNESDDLDAQDRRIVNVADPVDPGDAVNKDYIDTFGNTIYLDALTQGDRAEAEADAAEISADAAMASQNVATTKASDASNSADLAEAWAENPEDSAVETGKYSALHHAAKAEDSAAAALAQKNLCDAVAAQVVIDGQTSATNATNAAASSTSAQNWAANASASATAAGASEIAAAGYASQVSTQVANAEEAADEAIVAAATAATKASDASNSASLATTKAQVAIDNAALATTKATEAEASALAASNSAASALSNASAAASSATSASMSASTASTKAAEAASSAGTASSSKTDAINAKDAALTAQAECEAIEEGLQTASTHSHSNKPFLDELNEKTIAGYNVIRSQNLPPVGDYKQGTFCIVDAYEPKKLYMNIGLWWIEIPQNDSIYGKITKFDDVALLWRYEDGAQRSAVGPDPNWSYSDRMYAEDGSYVGLNEPTDLNGDGQLWWSGPAYTNLLTYSEQFDNVAWNKANVTVSANAALSPFGSLSADKITSLAGTNIQAINNQATAYAAGTYTFSFYVKSNGWRWIQYRTATGLGITYCNFDIINGVAGTATTTGNKIEDVGNGWWRISGIITILSATGDWALNLVDSGTAARNPSATGDGVSGIYLWGAQLTKTDHPVPYVKTTDTLTTVNQITDYVPAIHGDKGVWCGPSYTNMIRSNGGVSFSGPAWVATAGLSGGVQYVGDWYNLATTSTGAQGFVYCDIPSAISVGDKRVLSVSVERTDYRFIQLTFGSNSFGTGQFATFDLDAGSVAHDSGVSAQIIANNDGGFTLSICGAATADAISHTGIIAVVSSESLVGTRLPGSPIANAVLRLATPQLTATSTPMPYVLPGTTVASAAGTSGNNGIYFDMAEEPDGVELVYNGGFDDGIEGWLDSSIGTGSISASDSKLLLSSYGTSNVGITDQAISTVVGGKYTLSLTITSTTGSYNSIKLGTSQNGSQYTALNNLGVGIHTYTFVATSATLWIRFNGYYGTGTTTIDNISVQRLSSPLMQCFERSDTDGPATCTVAAEVTMGAGSGDISATTTWINILAPNTAYTWNSFMGHGYDAAYSTPNIITAFDGTQVKNIPHIQWSRNEKHLKIVQTNALGTQFRVGNKRIGIDSAIQWSAWTNFDGSFNPLTHIRLAFGNTVPIWFRRVMVSNLGGMSDAQIETRMAV